MKLRHYEAVEQKPVDMQGASGCKVRWLLSEADGTPTFAMRHYEVVRGGFTPKHSHPYEHEVFILAGEGTVLEGDHEHPIQAGDVIFVAPEEVHQFRNTGTEALRFLCLIPNSAKNMPVTMAPECGPL